MKKIYVILFLFCFIATFTLNAQTPWCGSEEYFRKKAEANPELERLRDEFFAQPQNVPSSDETGRSVPRIIPVVFHIIHVGGVENISKAQILDQIRILNDDYRRLNADTVNTPAPFRPLAADCDVEFRLAQKDTNGNCTDGIIRIYSTLSNNANDAVKALSHWPRDKYFNIWVVKTISYTPPFIILGYSSPPPPFSTPEEDGVVVRADYVGSIGTSSAAKAGRVLTHESGHWLGLQHIWGDNFCADDGINDTPVHYDANFGCPAFPHTNTCVGGDTINGEMFSNFMDYTNGNCQNMFSSGQKTQRIDLVLSNPLSRANLVSAANLVATGTDGTPAVLCSPVADFISVNTTICDSVSITFVNFSYNADTMTYNWQFPGGNPSTSTIKNPTVQYPTGGTYSVTLTATNAAGSSSRTRTSYIMVSGAAVFPVPYSNGFESANDFPSYDGYVVNPDGGNEWVRFTGAGSSGTSCIKMNNFTGNPNGALDDYVLPSINFTYLTQGTLTFKYAYAQRSSFSVDGLKVFVSTNCGQTWFQRMYLYGTSLATAPVSTGNFVPNSSQWVQQNITMVSYSGLPNIRVKFQGISDGGNNLYIDDVNINGVVGIDELNSDFNFFVYPNPSGGNVFISFTAAQETEAEIICTDAAGREVISFGKKKYDAGDNSLSVEKNLASGVYLVHVRTKNSVQTRRLVMIKN
ncbi:MAG TPA: PKD domain-containing protein [Bacteroidia bacterium]|nr:PKD domain-containing protein [Bacteroidia bacterium]